MQGADGRQSSVRRNPVVAKQRQAPETRRALVHERASFVHNQNIGKPMRQSPEPDIPSKRVKSESKLYSNVTKIESLEKQSSKPNMRLPTNKGAINIHSTIGHRSKIQRNTPY
jgi:hypothetical protein